MRLALFVVVALLVPAFASALPTPGANGAATLATLGRIFPEALQTNDYVSYDEAVAGLQLLDSMASDRVKIVTLGNSSGWTNPITQQHETTALFAVEVTNEKSLVPDADKLTLAFFLSIHGNEKGGREGGLRVIEDFARGVGLAAAEKELVTMLDYQKLVFIFGNTDGWVHEEVEYRFADHTPRSDGYTRENGNELDLNRNFPTVGYMFDEYTPLSESEGRAMVNYTQTLTNVVAGADIHGMLQNTNFVRLLLKDGEKTQQLLFENERLAELYKDRLNNNPKYVGWDTAPDAPGVCCGQVAEWAATFDAIGYSASGTAGAWIVQRQGMNAPGYTVELAYNHIVFDNYYPGPGAYFNDLHVEAVRDNVAAFMRFASEKVNLAVETHGKRIVVLTTPFVATTSDDDLSSYGGWFTTTDADDRYDILHKGYNATPNAYWLDMQKFVADGEKPGVLDLRESTADVAANLVNYDVLVIPGSASTRAWSASDMNALKTWVSKGGHLILTDSALQLLSPLGGIADDKIANKPAYSGYTDLVDRQHELVKDLHGYPRQTYDPNPLGFAPGTSPVWFVDRAAFESAGGTTVGAVGKKGTGEATVEDPASCGQPAIPLPIQLLRPQRSAAEKGADCQELDATNLGVLPVGAGSIQIFGAILPDPTEEANHPYGLDNHAVAANGNRIVLKMLGAEFVYATPPAIDELGFSKILAGQAAEAPASEPQAAKGVPSVGIIGLCAALLGVALARRR